MLWRVAWTYWSAFCSMTLSGAELGMVRMDGAAAGREATASAVGVATGAMAGAASGGDVGAACGAKACSVAKLGCMGVGCAADSLAAASMSRVASSWLIRSSER